MTKQEYTAEDKAWDDLQLASNPAPHFMQSSAWGESKSHSQWPVSRYIAKTKHGVLPLQVFSRTVPGLGRLHYAPEVSGITKQNIPALTEQLKRQYGKGLAFKMELYQPASPELLDAFLAHGWIKAHSVQHRNSVIVDLTGTEEELLASIKSRARYEVRVAQKNGVRVEKRPVTQANLDLLAGLIGTTAERTGAYFRDNSYTNKYWHAFARADQGSLYFAWHDKDLLAGAFIVQYGKTGWYKDGGSVRAKSSLMGPRFLLWEVMRDLQAQGLERFDLTGIPAPEDRETSSMKGLYAFKTGFSRETIRFMPAVELPLGKRYRLWPKAETHFLRVYSGLRKDFWY